MDISRILRGEIQWDPAGYLAALKWRADLLEIPRDDWPTELAVVPHLPGVPLTFDHTVRIIVGTWSVTQDETRGRISS